ncbi:MAG: hypothetical protein C0507_03265 [Cyanobacteria bacterium PR.3.49]|nr:hypothetical protein [Cyanobacteria bacterium PR.3.49]
MSDHKFWIISLLLLFLVFGLRFLYLQWKHNAAARSSAKLAETFKEVRLRQEEIWALYDDLLDEITNVDKEDKYTVIEFKTNFDKGDVNNALSLVRDAGYNVVLLAEGRVIYWPNLITANKNL